MRSDVAYKRCTKEKDACRVVQPEEERYSRSKCAKSIADVNEAEIKPKRQLPEKKKKRSHESSQTALPSIELLFGEDAKEQGAYAT
jgi:hypothetical protein